MAGRFRHGSLTLALAAALLGCAHAPAEREVEPVRRDTPVRAEVGENQILSINGQVNPVLAMRPGEMIDVGTGNAVVSLRGTRIVIEVFLPPETGTPINDVPLGKTALPAPATAVAFWVCAARDDRDDELWI